MRNSGTRLKKAMTEVAATVCGVTKGKCRTEGDLVVV